MIAFLNVYSWNWYLLLVGSYLNFSRFFKFQLMIFPLRSYIWIFCMFHLRSWCQSIKSGIGHFEWWGYELMVCWITKKPKFLIYFSLYLIMLAFISSQLHFCNLLLFLHHFFLVSFFFSTLICWQFNWQIIYPQSLMFLRYQIHYLILLVSCVANLESHFGHSFLLPCLGRL